MKIPFDNNKLDRLMDEQNIDFLLITDKDSVQYLLGGYRFFFLAHKDSIGISRYLPTIGYPKGDLENSFYIGNGLEKQQQDVEPIWIPNIVNNQWTSSQAGIDAAENIRKLGYDKLTIGIEFCHMPSDTYIKLKENLPNVKFVDALPLMQELRVIKTPEELEKLELVSNYITRSMEKVMTTTIPGTNTFDIAEELRRDEVNKGLNFEYCLVAAGACYNRTPSKKFTWNKGEVLSLDSGANLNGYLGDLCRMAVMGNPTTLMQDLLSQVKAIQDAPRKIIRAGITGREIIEIAENEKNKCDPKNHIKFMAHGMGIIQHEAPHLDDTGIVPYPAPYKDRPLESGMVLSIETDLKSDEVGLVKIEDTVVVTENGCKGFGDNIRDWVCNYQE